ncbi:MAG: STAS domain-containing protein [Candidatus Cloacimonetes bacterium]|nr:STAS domain-containing protein [Candidatus Cloacimonadota bacterium]
MEIKQQQKKNVEILSLVGRLDANTAGILEKKLIPLFDSYSRDVVIDFSELDYISSAGLRILLLAAKTARNKEGSIVLCSMQDFIREIFEIAGFMPVFKITNTLEEALQELEK